MDIVSLTKKAKASLKKANDLIQLEKTHKDLLGKNGEINLLLKTLRSLSPDKRKESGKALNRLKDELEEILQSKRNYLKDKAALEKLKGEGIDVSRP